MKKKRRITENPLMSEKKVKSIKMGNNSDDNEIKSFIIIVLVITLLIGVIYACTELLKKDNKKDDTDIVAGKINYDKISLGELLNRPYDEYYALIYNSQDSNSILYSTLLSMYKQKSSEDNYIKIYYIDLENQLNNKYYNKNNDNISNPKAEKIADLDLGDLTLIRIKNKKIVDYIEGYESIKKILK